MPADQFANNASSTLASGITSGATSLSVQSGHGARFDTPGNGFYLTLVDAAASDPPVAGEFEIVRCTAISTDTFTITRAQQGTSARAFDAGDTVQQSITAASADKWEAAAEELGIPASLVGPTGSYVSSAMHVGHNTAGSNMGQTPAAADGQIVFIPVRLARQANFDRISLNVKDAGDASSVLRLGVYDASGSQGLPGDLILDAGTVAADSTGLKEITISETLSGLVWLCAVWQGGVPTTQPTVFGPNLVIPYGNHSVDGNSVYPQVRHLSVSGALPSTATPEWVSSVLTYAQPRICLRVA